MLLRKPNSEIQTPISQCTWVFQHSSQIHNDSSIQGVSIIGDKQRILTLRKSLIQKGITQDAHTDRFLVGISGIAVYHSWEV